MGVWPDWKVLWLPILIILQTAFTLALAILLSALQVYYRDIASLTEIGLMVWFYMTPVIYPLYMAAGELRKFKIRGLFWIYLANPMAGLTAAYRQILFGSAMDPAEISPRLFYFSIVWALIFSIILWLIAAPVYRRLSRAFADEL